MQKVVCCFLSTFLITMVIGCSGGNVSLKGKVTFMEDDSPLTRGMVCFETDTFRARGPLMADGTYRVSSEKENDGIPPGTYRVYIYGAVVPADGQMDMGAAMGMGGAGLMPLVAEKYTKAKTSEITVQVDAKTS